jgi:hypothetical protein
MKDVLGSGVLVMEQRQKFHKNVAFQHRVLQEQLLVDSGQGSIYSNMLQINQECEKHLKMKVNL